MKIFRYITLSTILVAGLNSCKKEPENPWKIEVKDTTEKIEMTDISKEFYNPNVPLNQFKAQFPWFQGTVSDTDFAKRRADVEEIKIYKEAIGKIDQAKLQKDLQDLFSHIKHYFPQFKSPKVFLFSSALQMVQDPIFYDEKGNLLFIDVTGFMGDGNAHYKGLELYFQKSMNPQNIVPKVSQLYAENIVTESPDHQKFIDQVILNGKVMILQDAFLPDFPDYLKMNYTQKQYEWAKYNESNIWNYFVESNLLFGDDPRLGERFIAPGPFSKFYTEIDNESSPQIGIFTGWQICKAYLKEKPETKLTDFLKMDATQIFNESGYKPRVTK
ncbi:gliding motility protein GldB [Chryseobacterium indologenes]|uniref:gliding motility lipoprotein GldB n=1 Tax=Chryseobacterium TaxID=59732 RepID=UPI001629CED6|nr:MULTISPECIES: gliding motility protein GldB [Chryseobacterium]MDM1555631.1 gliding motility protein GldB [Chryseobacterium indologenes]WET51355.1 gliding motility protein GldB [Chryseobacterium indologenes]